MNSIDYYIEALSAELHTSSSKSIWKTIAEELLDVGAFGDLGNYAVALQALHLFTLDAVSKDLTAGKKTSDVVKKKEGEIEITYQTESASSQSSKEQNELLRTPWGIQLNDLINNVVTFAII